MSFPGGTRYKTYTPNGGHWSPRGSRYNRDGIRTHSPNGTNLRTQRPEGGSRVAPAFVRTPGRIRSPGGSEYRVHSPGRTNFEPARPRSPQHQQHSSRQSSSDKSSRGSASSTISQHRDKTWKLCRHYMHGHCAKGEHCRAKHGHADNRKRADLPARAKTPTPTPKSKPGAKGKSPSRGKGQGTKGGKPAGRKSS